MTLTKVLRPDSRKIIVLIGLLLFITIPFVGGLLLAPSFIVTIFLLGISQSIPIDKLSNWSWVYARLTTEQRIMFMLISLVYLYLLSVLIVYLLEKRKII